MKTASKNQISRRHRELSCIEALESRIAPATIIVTTLGDTPVSGKTDLRQALAQADADLLAHPGVVNKIIFKLPVAATQTENTITLGGTALLSNGDVNIAGPGAGKLIINGNNASGVFSIGGSTGTTTISGLSIINGNLNNGGGGIYCTESLTLKNVVISGNTSAFYGAGLNIHGNLQTPPKINIVNSLITGNSGQATGTSGIYLYQTGSFNISKTVISGNATGIDAAGVGTISNSIISGNAEYGIDLTTSKFTLSGTKVTGNASGGINLQSGDVLITGSTIQGNTAKYYGGGIRANNLTSLTISKSSIVGNRTSSTGQAEQGGGGLFIKGNGVTIPVKITGSNISNNSSALDGGGIFAENGVNLSIASSLVSGNQAASGIGGGVATRGNTASGVVNLSVAGSTFSNNLADRGGAIAAEGTSGTEGDGTFFMVSSKVAGNTSLGSDGGILAGTSASVTITNTSITNNFAEDCGGLDILDSSQALISGGLIAGNSSVGLGGGLRLFDVIGTIKGTTITDNVSGTAGGGIFENGNTVTITAPSKVFANTAPSDPDFHM